ncbi:MAG TPA: hypothetical protein VER55_15945 [Ardenticatenaceae bacterium]|nr:hypothetical protein [Ardenticatenaceae bacterium]
MALKIGISGLRGTVAQTEPGLTPDVALAWTRAFATLIQAEHGAGARIALGRDGRLSSPMVSNIARAALQSGGARVVDLGLTLTPTVQHAIASDPALSGGVMVTASHNPAAWNGLKFLDAQGRLLSIEGWAELEAIIAAGRYRTVALDQLFPVASGENGAWQRHSSAILSSLPVAQIRQRRLRVAFDACNSGAIRWQELFSELGCETIAVHTELTGFFAREPEPLPQYLGTLAHLVRATNCDVGLAADPDGDRLVLVDERGEPVSEEHTVVLCARERLAAGAGDTVVVNIVTTHAIEEAFPQARVLRTAVGEMNVVAGVLSVPHPALGGEGSGGIIVPGVNLARDGAAAAGLILSLLARTNQPLSALVAEIPAWTSAKSRLAVIEGSSESTRSLFTAWQRQPPDITVRSVSNGSELYAASAEGRLRLQMTRATLRLRVDLTNGHSLVATGASAGVAEIFTTLPTSIRGDQTSLVDGLKVWGAESWLSLRPSNTEPILRVMGEIRRQSRQ